MRFANKCRFLLVVLLTTGILWSAPHAHAVATSGGLTVTPATVTLSLGKNESEQRSTLTITNQYATPITLGFAFGTKKDALERDKQAAQLLRAALPSVTLAPSQSFAQTIIFSASDALPPGSQQVELIISQATTPGTAIGILPELRLPLITIKEEGAITNLALTTMERPAVGLALPSTIHATLQNTGNMIAIPRGVITITAPNGTVVGQGTLNTASAALSPGDSARFSTPITSLANATIPGPYNIHASYGLGGGQAAQTANTHFFYIAWWHLTLGATLAGGTYYVVRHILPARHYHHTKHRPPPKRPMFARRGAL